MINITNNINKIDVEIIDGRPVVNVLVDQFSAAKAEEAAKEAKEDAEKTALDRIATGEDRVATGEDRVATGLDAIATAADRVATGLDRIATGEDRTQTGLDRVATGNDVISSNTNATNALLAAQSIESFIQNLGSISGNININLVLGTLIIATLTGSTVLTFSGLPTADRETVFTLRFSGIQSITLPIGTKYAEGKIPVTEGLLYEIPCTINSAGDLIVYGSINNIETV